METLYNAITKTNKIKKEIKETEKLISKYINQRKIRKVLFKGLKENNTMNYTPIKIGDFWEHLI